MEQEMQQLLSVLYLRLSRLQQDAGEFELTEWNKLVRYCGGGGVVAVPPGVREIGSNAFLGRRDVTELILPDGVVKIGHRAFYGCSGLKRIVLPEGLKELGAYAFYGCSELREIVFPKSLKEIGRYALKKTAWLESQTAGCVIANGILVDYQGKMPETLVVPEGVTAVADCACDELQAKLETLILPESLCGIGASAFGGCHTIKCLDLGNGVQHIGEGAFSHSDLREIRNGNSLWMVGEGAFEKTPWIQEERFAMLNNILLRCNCEENVVVIPQQVWAIQSRACWSSEPKRFIIQGGFCAVEPHAFCGNAVLQTDWNSPVQEYAQREGIETCLSMGEMDSLLRWRLAREGLEEIELFQNRRFDYVTEIILTEQFDYGEEREILGLLAERCPRLQRFSVAGGRDPRAQGIIEVDGVLFDRSQMGELDLVHFPTGRTGTYTPPEGTRGIWEGAFRRCALEGVQFPKTLRWISEGAFWACNRLRNVYIPESVTFIGDLNGENPFPSCQNLTEVIVAPDNREYFAFQGMLYDSRGTLLCCPAGYRGAYAPEPFVKAFCDRAFEGCGKLTEVTFPDNAKYVGNGTFRDCTGLTGMVLPESVESIGARAFMGCTNLEQLVIQNLELELDTYGDLQRFQGCGKLTIYAGERKTPVSDEMSCSIRTFAEQSGIPFRTLSQQPD